MLAPSSRRRWGRLQLQTLRAFIAHDGRALTSELAGWCWPELVLVGGKPSWWQLKSQARAIRNGRLPDAAGDRLIDAGFSKDRIAAIEPNIISEAPSYDAEGCLCCGGLIETHIHLDKSRIATAVRRSLVGVLRSSGEADLHGGGYLYLCEGDARELHQAAVPRSRN